MRRVAAGQLGFTFGGPVVQVEPEPVKVEVSEPAAVASEDRSPVRGGFVVRRDVLTSRVYLGAAGAWVAALGCAAVYKSKEDASEAADGCGVARLFVRVEAL